LDPFALFVALAGSIALINFKELSKSIIKTQQDVWHGGKPVSDLTKKSTRTLLIVVSLASILFGLYDGLKGIWQR
jgi:hypothetical protein